MVLALACACTAPLEFADWTIPVPDGTPIIDYAPVPVIERTETIQPIEDLVIGDRDDDPNYMFYRPQIVDADVYGNIYVLDRDDKNVKVFDEEGRWLRTLSREGQGPGELRYPYAMAVLPDRVVVNDYENARWSHWSLDGEHLGDFGLDTPRLYRAWPAGRDIVALEHDRMGNFLVPLTAVALSAEGEELRRLVAAPYTPFARAAELDRRLLGAFTLASIGVGARGEVYFAAGEEYQVRKYRIDGVLDWALRVAQAREPTPREDIEAEFAEIRENRPDELLSEFHWAERLPALAGITTDGHGHVWVFPYIHRPYGDTSTPTERPVDVYNAAGERLFAGWIALPGLWTRARGDHIYRIETDADDERVVRRYRLVEPFE